MPTNTASRNSSRTNKVARLSHFRFQRFTVRQERATLRVCTDATLFGAMAPVRGGERVLDIGAGTGLLALIAAQLGASHVTAVEIDPEACREAAANFDASPWRGQLDAVPTAIQEFAQNAEERFDLIISNPPFFENHSKSASSPRNLARHTDRLSYTELIEAVDRLLAPAGLLYLLLPTGAVARFAEQAQGAGMFLIGRRDIRGHGHNPAKVAALTVRRQPAPLAWDQITLFSSPGVYSAEGEAYLSPFLLRFADRQRG